MGSPKRRKARPGPRVTLDYPADSETAKMHAALRDIEGVLRDFSKKVRKRVTLHFVKHEVRAVTPYPDDGILHIVVGAAAPGAIDECHLAHACGVRLDAKGMYLEFWGPTLGIGTLVKDAEKQTIGQVVDGTVYLFIPSPGRSSFLFEGSGGRDLYARALAFVHAAMKKGGEPKSKKIADLARYSEFVKKSLVGLPMLLGARKALLDIRIQEATEKLNSLYAERETFTRLCRIQEARNDEEQREIPSRDWPRIREHPLVERVLSVEDALHVQTRRIIAEHGGKRFDFGRFMIRLPLGGKPSIWPIEYTHPKRVAHPHISPSSVVCFGNATSAITQAAGEGRIADALDLIFSWLTEGYDPNLADSKIEEWPEVRAQKRRAA